MSMSFPLYASYAQVAIFLSSLEQPFNNWTDRHVAQGFAWREGSVSFAVTDGGDCFVEILLNDDQSSIVSETIREIWVPFNVINTRLVCASISDENEFSIPIGLYQLKFRMMKGGFHNKIEFDYFLSFTFSQSDSPIFLIAKFNPEVEMPDNLLLNAEPAK